MNQQVTRDVLTAPLFDLNEVNEILRLLLKSEQWSAGAVRYGSKSRQDDKIRKQMIVPREVAVGPLKNFMEEIVSRAISFASETFGLPKQTLYADLAQYQLTNPGGYFEWHSDALADGSRQAVVLIFLSDFDEGLVGGETEFKVDSKVYAVRPQKGLAIAFRPQVRHRGAKVIVGQKFAAVICLSAQKS